MHSIFHSILSGFLEKNVTGKLNTSELSDLIVQASVNIYSIIQTELLPTPTRAHYTFNLRDLSKVFQGILLVSPNHLNTEEEILMLWCHEVQRVFRDRLIDEGDRTWFNSVTLEQVHTTLGAVDWQLEHFANVIFGNFMSKGQRDYQEIRDGKVLNTILTEALEEYNVMTTSARMELVFFEDAANHLTRISRILAQPRGNALLVGVGGSGRQSLTHMAAFIADFKVQQIEITRGYGMAEWREALKQALQLSGVKNTPTVFMLSDSQIVLESFLDDLSNLLNSGEIPNLYEVDELEAIVSAVRPSAKAAGKGLTRDGILQHYISLVRNNLHIVLCMSPIGSSFRSRCRMFPSLVNCCTIDWFNAWPQDALFSVAAKMFDEQDAKFSLGITDYIKPLAHLCNTMHRTVEAESERFSSELKRRTYTTPTSYLELLKLYVDLLKQERETLQTREHRYRTGLSKLKDTENIVAKLEISLTEMQPVLVKASVETTELLGRVTLDTKAADAQQAVVEVVLIQY